MFQTLSTGPSTGYIALMNELGWFLQLVGLIIVPTALLRPFAMEEFGILMFGAGLFLVGRYLVREDD